jgi:hypothetical protein
MTDSLCMGKHGMLLGALLLSGCGINELEPPATPPRAPVTIDPTRIPAVRPPGTGRVALDAVGGEAQVEEVVDVSAGFESPAAEGAKLRVVTLPLCLSPCIADLGYGHHILRYSATTTEGVSHVSFAPLNVKKGNITIVRHALGHYRTSPGWNGFGSFSLVAGIPLVVVGTGLLVVGGSHLAGDSQDAQNLRGTFSTAGDVTFVLGAILTAAGIIIKVAARDEYQPGATVQFEEPEPEPPKPPPATPPATDAGTPPVTPPP